MNGNTGTWVSRGLTLSALLAIITLLMGQAKEDGIQATLIDTTTGDIVELKDDVGERVDKMDKFIEEQIKINTETGMTQDRVVDFLEQQVELNEALQRHLMKADLEDE